MICMVTYIYAWLICQFVYLCIHSFICLFIYSFRLVSAAAMNPEGGLGYMYGWNSTDLRESSRYAGPPDLNAFQLSWILCYWHWQLHKGLVEQPPPVNGGKCSTKNNYIIQGT